MPEPRGLFISESLEKRVRKFMLQAWDENKWIYDCVAKKWYTPSEFKNNWQQLVTEYNFGRFEVRSPIDGWNDTLNEIQRLVQSSDELKRKMDDYFDLDLKRKK